MRKLITSVLLAGSAALAGCATVAPAPSAYAACGGGYVDLDNDGWLEANEWNAYRAGGYAYWDTDRDGRISRSEFERCWYGGGFYRADWYNRDYWRNYWTAFDANGDGYLSNDEYWSGATWTRMDRNRNGRIDSDEWRWW